MLKAGQNRDSSYPKNHIWVTAALAMQKYPEHQHTPAWVIPYRLQILFSVFRAKSSNYEQAQRALADKDAWWDNSSSPLALLFILPSKTLPLRRVLSCSQNSNVSYCSLQTVKVNQHHFWFTLCVSSSNFQQVSQYHSTIPEEHLKYIFFIHLTHNPKKYDHLQPFS